MDSRHWLIGFVNALAIAVAILQFAAVPDHARVSILEPSEETHFTTTTKD